MIIHNTKEPGWVKLKLALVGQAGAGKTHSLRTLLKAKRKPLVVDAGGGMLTLLGENIPFVTVNSWNPYKYETDDSGDIKKRIYPEDDLNAIMRDLQAEEALKYDTIVFDLLTTLQNMLAQSAGRQHPDDGFAKWGDVKDYCEKLVNVCYHRIPHDIIFICSASLKEDALRGSVLVRPNFKGQFGDDFAHYPDELYYAERTQVGDEAARYIWNTVPGPRLECKSRIRGDTELLPERMDADFVTLYKVIAERFKMEKKGNSK